MKMLSDLIPITLMEEEEFTMIKLIRMEIAKRKQSAKKMEDARQGKGLYSARKSKQLQKRMSILRKDQGSKHSPPNAYLTACR